MTSATEEVNMQAHGMSSQTKIRMLIEEASRQSYVAANKKSPSTV